MGKGADPSPSTISLDGRQIWDISPAISEKTAVFPGDRSFSRKVVVDFATGANFKLSQIETTVHIGAHVDAPNHYAATGSAVDERPLDIYLGACQVIAVDLPRDARIRPVDLATTPVRAKRVLFKTSSFPDPNRWTGDFNSLSPELVHHLADEGVVLIGIDTPSVDPAEDKELRSHQALHARGLANLEGVVLNEVEPGLYQLIALPLRLQGADASPVRAILCR